VFRDAIATRIGTRDAYKQGACKQEYSFNQLQRSITMKQKASLFLIAAFLLGLVSGCNTMAGAGKDIQKGGEKLENSADKSKTK
jgi:predicted small secreted protein